MGEFTTKLCAYSTRLDASVDEAFDLAAMFSSIADSVTDLGLSAKDMVLVRIKAKTDPKYAAILSGEEPPKMRKDAFSSGEYFYIGGVKAVEDACMAYSSKVPAPISGLYNCGFIRYPNLVIDGITVQPRFTNRLRTMGGGSSRIGPIGGSNVSIEAGLAKIISNFLKSGKTYFSNDELAAEDKKIYEEFVSDAKVLEEINRQFDQLCGDIGTPKRTLSKDDVINMFPYDENWAGRSIGDDLYEVAMRIPVKGQMLIQRMNALPNEDKDYARCLAKQKKFLPSGKGVNSWKTLGKDLKKAISTGASAWDSMMARRPRVS